MAGGQENIFSYVNPSMMNFREIKYKIEVLFV